MTPRVFIVGDMVRTRKGASFRGAVVVLYESLNGTPHAVVEAVHPHFEATEHLYPLAQLEHDPMFENDGGRP